MQSCSYGPRDLLNLGGNGFVGFNAALDVLQSVANSRVIFSPIYLGNFPVRLREKPPRQKHRNMTRPS
jgi:hypothetical protein